jgi:hypothetical protein
LSLTALAATGTAQLVVLQFQRSLAQSEGLEKKSQAELSREDHLTLSGSTACVEGDSGAKKTLGWQADELQSIPFPANVTDFVFAQLTRLPNVGYGTATDLATGKGNTSRGAHEVKQFDSAADGVQRILQPSAHVIVAVRDSNLLRVFPVRLHASDRGEIVTEVLDTSVRLSRCCT